MSQAPPEVVLTHPRFTLKVNPFRVTVSLADQFVCGGADGSFEVSCSVTTRGLTPEGFVVEVHSLIERVQARFGGCGMLKASCEELAGGVLHVASEMLGDRLEAATVHVANLTGGVELAWQKGEVVPSFPRPATSAERRATVEARSTRRPAEPRGC